MYGIRYAFPDGTFYYLAFNPEQTWARWANDEAEMSLFPTIGELLQTTLALVGGSFFEGDGHQIVTQLRTTTIETIVLAGAPEDA